MIQTESFASFSTDGIDGHSDLAGALADMDTIHEARRHRMDYKSLLQFTILPLSLKSWA